MTTLTKAKHRFDAEPAAQEITDHFLRAFKMPTRHGALHLGKEAEWQERVRMFDAQVEKIVSRHFARFLAEEGKCE